MSEGASVRCRFRLAEVHLFPKGYKKFIFYPEYDSTIEEGRRIAKANPSGKIEINVDNPTVDWQVGSYYYFDVSPVPEDKCTPSF